MKLLGDNGAGYELAQRLEENSVWRAWLGERDFVLLQSYLATPGTWSAFMQIENPSVTALQLRVRALLFDKALVFLHLNSAATSPPSALDNSCKLGNQSYLTEASFSRRHVVGNTGWWLIGI